MRKILCRIHIAPLSPTGLVIPLLTLSSVHRLSYADPVIALSEQGTV